MIRVRRGVVIALGAARPGAHELEVDVDGERATAIAYPELCGPVTVGDMVTVIVQLFPAATGFEQPLAAKPAPAVLSLADTLDTDRDALPVFVTCTAVPDEVVPTLTLPTSTLPGALTAGAGAAVPVPDTCTASGEVDELLVMTSCADSGPVELGENATSALQELA